MEHNGKYHKISGPSQVHPSPQRTHLLFQAGTSKAGTSFAAKHAEAMFLNSGSPEDAAKSIKNAGAEAVSQGRDPYAVKFFPCIIPIIGKDGADAKMKQGTALKYADTIAGLGQILGYTGIGMSQFPLDEPVEVSEKPGMSAIVSTFRALEAINPTGEPWTPRRVRMRMALGGLHPCPVGSAEEVADVFKE